MKSGHIFCRKIGYVCLYHPTLHYLSIARLDYNGVMILGLSLYKLCKSLCGDSVLSLSVCGGLVTTGVTVDMASGVTDSGVTDTGADTDDDRLLGPNSLRPADRKMHFI